MKVREIFTGFASLLTGMRITLVQFIRNFTKGDHNVAYPHKVLPIPDRYRGHIILVKDPESGKSLCIACKSCEKACPSDCILVEGEKKEEKKGKSVAQFGLDFTKCSLCGACIEVCPVKPIKAIAFSKRYNLAGPSKTIYAKLDLVKDLEDRSK